MNINYSNNNTNDNSNNNNSNNNNNNNNNSNNNNSEGPGRFISYSGPEVSLDSLLAVGAIMTLPRDRHRCLSMKYLCASLHNIIVIMIDITIKVKQKDTTYNLSII